MKTHNALQADETLPLSSSAGCCAYYNTPNNILPSRASAVCTIHKIHKISIIVFFFQGEIVKKEKKGRPNIQIKRAPKAIENRRWRGPVHFHVQLNKRDAMHAEPKSPTKFGRNQVM